VLATALFLVPSSVEVIMVRVSVLNDALKSMYNAEKRGKRQVMIRPSSKVIIKFLTVMQRHGYIGEFDYVDDHRARKLVVELNDRLNKCGVISPWFDFGIKKIDGWTARLLPSSQFGYIVLQPCIELCLCAQHPVTGRRTSSSPWRAPLDHRLQQPLLCPTLCAAGGIQCADQTGRKKTLWSLIIQSRARIRLGRNPWLNKSCALVVDPTTDLRQYPFGQVTIA
jgi:small subunit ribosomal protein S15Ae